MPLSHARIKRKRSEMERLVLLKITLFFLEIVKNESSGLVFLDEFHVAFDEKNICASFFCVDDKDYKC